MNLTCDAGFADRNNQKPSVILSSQADYLLENVKKHGIFSTTVPPLYFFCPSSHFVIIGCRLESSTIYCGSFTMGRVICISNQKGGVGKTTTAVNLSACIALAERRTLLIDLDPQGNASSGLGIRVPTSKPSVYHLLLGLHETAEMVVPTAVDHLQVIPATQDLIGAEVEFIDVHARESLLAKAISPLIDNYDYIFIDCPPSLGLLTLNALVAADSVLIPIQCEYYALEGVGSLLNTIRRVTSAFNRRLKIEGFLLTMFDPRTNLSQQVVQDVHENLGGQVFKTIIPRNVKLSESPSFGKPVVLYDITSRGAISYFALAKEIIDAEHTTDATKTIGIRAGA